MTRLLEQAIERLRTVSDAEQDQLARLLLNELDEEQRWGASTAAHAQALEQKVAEVLAADDRGACEPLDLGTL